MIVLTQPYSWLSFVDLMLSSWPDEPDSSGVKVRNISYTLSLNYTIGPKCSPSTERQVHYGSYICWLAWFWCPA